ncbi:hypothetical protein JCM10207_008522 [Rhodosporidiobolus poonsookiae]
MKRGFLLGKKASSTAPAQTAPSKEATTSANPIQPLTLPPTTSFATAPVESSTLHWSFYPTSSSPELALHATTRTVTALLSTPYFSSPSPPPLPAFTPLFSIVNLPGKGKSVLATADLAADSLVLLDRPLLVYAPEALPRTHTNAVLSHALSRLAPAQQAQFLALSNCFPVSSEGAYLGRAETNALPVVSLDDLPPSAAPADEVTYSGVFPLVARLNHACDANCRLEFSAQRWALGVRTTRAVRKGEELCISYIVPFQKRRERMKELRLKWRFECQCGWCSLSDEDSAKRDLEREEKARLFLQQWDAQAADRR